MKQVKVRAAEVNPGTSDLLQYACSHIDGAVMTIRTRAASALSHRHDVELSAAAMLFFTLSKVYYFLLKKSSLWKQYNGQCVLWII